MAIKKAVVIGFDTSVEMVDYDKKDEYRFLSDAVDGYIEMVALKGTQLTMYVNEEGKLEGLPFNDIATSIFQAKFGAVDIIMGNAVLVGAQKELDKVMKLFGE